MRSALLQELRELAGEDCARCDGPMVITRDALQRPRKRCPRCDGLSQPRAPHPDTVLAPVKLLALSSLSSSLPPIEPGQLRCQGCAHGVVGDVRFCDDCKADRKKRPCIRCQHRFKASRRWQQVCDTCEAKAAPPAVTVCTGCNRIRPRKKRERFRTSSCEECRIPASDVKPTATCRCGAVWPRKPQARRMLSRCSECQPDVRTCLGCGATAPRPKGSWATVKKCPACPRKPRPTHAQIRWKLKKCQRGECRTIFQPTGPRSLYCEAHR